MDSIPNQSDMNNHHEQELLTVLLWKHAPIFHGAFVTAVELNLFEIIAKAGPDAQLSAAEITSHLPTQNQHAASNLDRILKLLASCSFVNCTLASDKDGNRTTLYGLTPMSKHLVPDQEGVSLTACSLWHNEKSIRDACYSLKDAILEGGIAYNKANGIQFHDQVRNFSTSQIKLLDKMLHSNTVILMRDLLQLYQGFEELKEIVDVGGGHGSTLNEIISKYPWITGINFDLPHVIENASVYPGVQNIEGDMLQYVPKGETILIKTVLLDFSDDNCLKVLKNCWNALPENGKLIIIDIILPEFPETDLHSRISYALDVFMFSVFPTGIVRTQKEFDNLAIKAGFTASQLACRIQQYGILELYKK